MNRTPIDVLEIEFGEDATYAPASRGRPLDRVSAD